ncbi:MAG: phosphotransferase [Acidobacteria bacterium]|nr:phosphotransferase [Acidobacteriota bacterium]
MTRGFSDLVPALLGAAGLPTQFKLSHIRGGANNRVYRVVTLAGDALLKVYFHHEGDARDRLGTEFSFCQFAWDAGLKLTPRPLSRDPRHGLGLYEFIRGRVLCPSDVIHEHVLTALTFYRDVNRKSAQPAARVLPIASEACFSIAAHIGCVERRLDRLGSIPRSSSIERDAESFVKTDLNTVWDRVRHLAWKEAAGAGVELSDELTTSERRLSPSDFGFHNAILQEDGQLRFIDLEYAGWDDPAKLVCDFFCQPAVPVNRVWLEELAAAIAEDQPDPDRFLRRCAILWPVYQVKWCCILLNDFLVEGEARRGFALKQNQKDQRRARQLEKSKRMLGSLAEWPRELWERQARAEPSVCVAGSPLRRKDEP